MRRWLQTRKRRLETRVASDTENGVLRREHQNRQSTCQDAWLEIDANVSHHSCRDTASSLTPYSTMCRYHVVACRTSPSHTSRLHDMTALQPIRIHWNVIRPDRHSHTRHPKHMTDESATYRRDPTLRRASSHNTPHARLTSRRDTFCRNAILPPCVTRQAWRRTRPHPTWSHAAGGGARSRFFLLACRVLLL